MAFSPNEDDQSIKKLLCTKDFANFAKRNPNELNNPMKTCRTFAVLFCLTALCGCQKTTKSMKEKETEVLIETSMGDLKVKLYNDTPNHRDNFIKLARSGAYDNMLFHRIVREFMIQTGDPSLKPEGARPTVDTTAYHYTLPAEIVYPRHFHKKGALAAARQPDSINPGRASSGTQFYIVTGKVFSPGALMELQMAIYENKVSNLYEELSHKHMKEMYLMRKRGEKEQLQALKDSILQEAEQYMSQNPPQPFNEVQKKTYATEGGAPHLDGEYTVFGEVTEGMAVAEAIEKIKTNGKERPLKEVFVKKVTVLD